MRGDEEEALSIRLVANAARHSHHSRPEQTTRHFIVTPKRLYKRMSPYVREAFDFSSRSLLKRLMAIYPALLNYVFEISEEYAKNDNVRA